MTALPHHGNHTYAIANAHSKLAKSTCLSLLYKCANRFIELREFPFISMLGMHTRFECRSESFSSHVPSVLTHSWRIYQPSYGNCKAATTPSIWWFAITNAYFSLMLHARHGLALALLYVFFHPGTSWKSSNDLRCTTLMAERNKQCSMMATEASALPVPISSARANHVANPDSNG